MKLKIYLFAVCCCFFQCEKKEISAEVLIKEIKTNGKKSDSFKYNADNQLVEHQTFFDDGQSVWESRRFDWKNNLIEKMEFWSSHPLFLSTWPAPGKPLALQSVEKYQYDENNRIARIDFDYSGAKIKPFCTFAYDLNGRKSKKMYHLETGEINRTYIYEYQNNANVIKFESSYWTYDKHSNPFKKLNISDPMNPSWNADNNAVSNYGVDAQGNKYNNWEYQYTYDAITKYPLTAKVLVDGKLIKNMEFIY